METKSKDKAVIARRFTAFREKFRVIMSQTQLGELIGISGQAVDNIESKRVMPTRITWESFCALEVRHARAKAEEEALKKLDARPW